MRLAWWPGAMRDSHLDAHVTHRYTGNAGVEPHEHIECWTKWSSFHRHHYQNGFCRYFLVIEISYDNKSVLVQVQAEQATSHYLNQWWHRYMAPCGVTTPPCIKIKQTLWIRLCVAHKQHFIKIIIAYNYPCASKTTQKNTGNHSKESPVAPFTNMV